MQAQNNISNTYQNDITPHYYSLSSDFESILFEMFEISMLEACQV